MRKGLSTSDGERVYLKHERKGSQLFTTLDWIDEFHRELDMQSAANLDFKSSHSTNRTKSRVSQQVANRLGV